MEKVSQDAYARQRMLAYCSQHGVTKTSIRYNCSRKTVYKWKRRWDGRAGSLEERSRRPHRSPCKQSESEEKLVMRYARKYPGDHLFGYQKACQQRVYPKLRIVISEPSPDYWASQRQSQRKRKGQSHISAQTIPAR